MDQVIGSKRFCASYQRISEKYSPDAVQWWYFEQFEDEWAFARGGKCRKVREARRLIREAEAECRRERHRFLSRPTFVMETDGSLRPIQEPPYQAVQSRA
jgi:hypothetical protein